jgi:CHAD domain-containing protein
MRIRAKQLRYAAETAEPVIGERARRVALAAEEAQGVLGDLHDTVAAQEWLATNARDASGPAAFTAGVLAADQVRRREVLRHQWRSCWRRLDRKKVRGWLDRG